MTKVRESAKARDERKRRDAFYRPEKRQLRVNGVLYEQTGPDTYEAVISEFTKKRLLPQK